MKNKQFKSQIAKNNLSVYNNLHTFTRDFPLSTAVNKWTSMQDKYVQ